MRTVARNCICGGQSLLVNGHTVLGILEEWEQGGIATPPAACGHPPSVCFSKQLHWRWGQVGPSQLGAAVQVLCPPILTPPLPTSLSPLSVSLLSATVKQLDHLPTHIDFCFPISKLDGRKRLKTVCQFEVE